MAIPVQIPISWNPWFDGWIRMWGWVAPSDYSDPNPTHGDIFGKGWFQAHRTTADRDTIIESRRSRGMGVSISSPIDPNYKKLFILVEWLVDANIMNNSNWLEFTGGGTLSYYTEAVLVDWQTAFTLPAEPAITLMFVNWVKINNSWFSVVWINVTYLALWYPLDTTDTVEFYYM